MKVSMLYILLTVEGLSPRNCKVSSGSCNSLIGNSSVGLPNYYILKFETDWGGVQSQQKTTFDQESEW